MNDLSKRIANLSPEQQALLALLAKRKGVAAPEPGSILRRQGTEVIPLSFSQQRLWFLEQLTPGTPFYNEPLLALRFNGPLDRGALQRTLDEVVRRHEILRTTFPHVDGEPRQVVAPHAPVPLHVVDLRALAEPEREDELRRVAEREARYVFDLAAGPLLRCTLVRMREAEHVVLLEMHHIITDGWSNRVLLREVSELYGAFSAGRPSPLPELPIQYADFAIWQRQWLTGVVLERLLSYWKKQLGGRLPVLSLPTDYLRPPVQTSNGAAQCLVMPRELNDALKELSRREGVTLFMTLLAAFLTLLYRYSGQEEIVVGSPVANRNRSETERLVGFFVNTLALRADLSGNPRFRDLLARVREVTTSAYAHQEMPFEKLVDLLQPERDLSRQAVHQVMFGLHNYPTRSLDVYGLDAVAAAPAAPGRAVAAGGLSMEGYEVETTVSKFDLAVAMSDLEEMGLKAQLDYNTDLFKAVTASRLLQSYEALLRSVVAQPDVRLNALGMSAEAQGQPPAHSRQREEAFAGRLKGARRRPVNLS
jgi:hypothetical protein